MPWSLTVFVDLRVIDSRLRQLPLVSVAVIAGPAVGGGAELTTACDTRVVSSTAHIQFVQAKASCVIL